MERLAINVVRLSRRPGAHAGASMDTPEELIARARLGDEEAFSLIFERYTRPVISFIFYMVRRRELAEELAQETFLRAYRSLRTLHNAAKLSTWLFGIARNVALESLRSRDRERREIAGSFAAAVCDEQTSPAGRLLDKELGEVIGSALMALDEDKRLVFTLRVYQQRSYDEIAEITGFSLPKIRNDIHRARAEMRRRLKNYLGQND